MSGDRIFPPQEQEKQPGLQNEMNPTPAVGESYKAAGKLKGKKLLITGGDSGIGRSVVVMAAMEGVDGITILHTEREIDDAQETVKQAEKHGARVVAKAGDIADVNVCKNMVEDHIKNFKTIDILVNNAAEQHVCEFLGDIDLQQVERTFKTNIFGMFNITKFALQHMKSGSKIVNSTSVTAYKGRPDLIDYSSTKGAITAFTRSLSQQLASRNIRVNGVAPGPIWTPLIPASFSKEEVESFGKETPLGRPGQPSEVAPCYVFLASEDSSYITGSVLHPNGGSVVNS
ncbi:3-oxoacyl-reductase [Umbelopsis sp. PMI_123]|nr:3-oxoacyl-reductase [Umbelopsis sp. PMI_123]